MFTIGQNIVYPMHGAGVVEAIESKTVGNNTADYYKVRIFMGNVSLLVPVVSVGGVNMREVVDCDVAGGIVEHFNDYRTQTDIPWNKRYKTNVDKLKSGDLKQVAGVLADLILREKTHGLSTSDRKMFVLAKNIFCSEVSVALSLPCEQVFDKIIQCF